MIPPTEASDLEDTVDLRLPDVPDDIRALFAQGFPAAPPGGPFDGGLLDSLSDWGPLDTSLGTFELVPVRPERDLPALSRWMNDPAVAAFWELDGPESVTAEHLRR